MAKQIAYKNLIKYPLIDLKEDMWAKVREWYQLNSLSPLVPPVYDTFVIRWQQAGRINVPISDVPKFKSFGLIECDHKPENIGDLDDNLIPFKPEPHRWMILYTTAELLIQYNNDKTAYHADLFEDGKKSYEFDIDYNNFFDNKLNIHLYMFADNAGDKTCVDSTKRHVNDTAWTVAAVQSYILYHKPQEIDAPPKERVITSDTRTEQRRQNKRPITIKPSVRRVITIDKRDHIPVKRYNYYTMVWNVRGHYSHRGADKHLTYIAPYICRRNDNQRKAKPQKYIIKNDKEQ